MFLQSYSLFFNNIYDVYKLEWVWLSLLDGIQMSRI